MIIVILVYTIRYTLLLTSEVMGDLALFLRDIDFGVSDMLIDYSIGIGVEMLSIVISQS